MISKKQWNVIDSIQYLLVFLERVQQGKLTSVCLLTCICPFDCTDLEAAPLQDADSLTGTAPCCVTISRLVSCGCMSIRYMVNPKGAVEETPFLQCIQSHTSCVW